MGIVVFLIALSIMIFIHELGHFLVARFFGVKVDVFSIGFGKKVLSFKSKKTEYKLALIPLGGYVKLKGQDDSDPTKKNYDEDSYTTKSPIKRICILLAGPIANILLSFVIYFGVIFSTGITYVSPVIGTVLPDSVALGILQPKDKIIAVNNIEVKTTAEVINFDKTKTLLYTVLRDGEVLNIELKPKEMIVKNIFGEDETKLLVGIRFDANASFNENASFSQALVESYKSTVFACTLVIKSLQKLIIGAVSPTNLSGIVGMGYVSDKLYQTSFLSFLILMALISANLGIINLLPIPALDGGHIVFNLYEMIFRKEVTLLAVKILTFIGWFILFTLLFFTLYNDIYKIFTNTMIP